MLFSFIRASFRFLFYTPVVTRSFLDSLESLKNTGNAVKWSSTMLVDRDSDSLDCEGGGLE